MGKDLVRTASQRTREQDALDGVYVIRSELTGYVKIGYSKNIQKRIKQLRTAIPGSVELLGVIGCSPGVEHQLHRQLKDFRVHGGGREWYLPTVLDDAVLLSMMKED